MYFIKQKGVSVSFENDLNTETNTDLKQETNSDTLQYTEFLNQLTDKDGKPKYASIEDALKGAIHAQQHIAKLETDNDQLRNEKQRLEETVTEFVKPKETASEVVTPTEQAPQDSGPDIDAMFNAFKQRLEQEQAQRLAEQRVAEAKEALAKQYGERSEEVLNKTAQELGISTEHLMSQAATSPALFNKIVGLGTATSTKADFTQSSVSVTPKPAPSGKPIEGVMLGKADPTDLWNSI